MNSSVYYVFCSTSFVFRWQQRENRYVRGLYFVSAFKYQSASRCSKLDVNRKWLTDAKFHHSLSGWRNKRYDGEKDEERGRISYGNGSSYCVSFQSKIFTDRIEERRF